MVPLSPQEKHLTTAYQNTVKALETLHAALADLERIKTFKAHQEEIEKIFSRTFDTFWHYIQEYLLIANGVEHSSPKEVFRELTDAHLVTKEELAIFYHMTDRVAQVAHTHNQDTAVKIAYSLPSYYTLMQKIIEALKPL